jgi:polysaccharide biosynthesis protein VpsQ
MIRETDMKWLTLACAVFIAAIVIAADKGRLPGFITALYDFPAGDKVGHAILFGILAFVLNMSVPMAPPTRPWLSLALSTLALAALVAAEEMSQSVFAGRHASWADLASSYTGIALFSCLAWTIRRRRPRHAV